MASISLQAYHKTCSFDLAEWHDFPISTNVSVKLGSIGHFTGPGYENSFEIAFAPDVVIDDQGWSTAHHMVDRMWNRYVSSSLLSISS
jgi:hypothetical protein